MSAAIESDPKMETPPLPDHKPAFLKRVQIRNYKSIAFCDVTLEPLTLLVGRNGSGKSNFLDALGFLADLMEKKISESITARGGWRSTVSKSYAHAAIEFRIEMDFPSHRSHWTADFSFSIRFDGSNGVVIESEVLKLTEINGSRICGYQQNQHGFKWIGADLFKDNVFDEQFIPTPERYRSGSSDRLFITSIGSHPFIDLIELLGKSSIHNFYPAAMRMLQPFQAGMMLSSNGDTLPYAIKVLDEIDTNSLLRVKQFLHAIVPEVDEFRVQDYGDFETVRFKLVSNGSNGPREFDASSMSDGTLRAIAALIASRQIILPMGQGFIGIEEPETSLHPAAMHALVDALDEATLLKQIILTTHSSEILDNPTIKPKNVRVVRMIDGHTVIAPVDKVYHDIIRRELNTLGGLERDNLLEPDLDDLDRQQKLADAPREAAA